MRIPSDFNDDNLYRRGIDPDLSLGAGQSRRRRPANRDRSTTTRRLLRLVVGLVVVMFLMRHASRPEIYHPFFAEPMQKVPNIDSPNPTTDASGGATPGPATPVSMDAEQAVLNSQERPSSILYPADSPQFGEAIRIAHAFSEDDQRVVLAAKSSNDSPAEISSLVRTTLDALDGASDPAELDKSRWSQFADDLTAQSDDAATRRLFATLQHACLRAAMDRVIDGSVWRGKDLDAFYGALIHREIIESLTRVKTGVIPLLQQPDVYRGRAVTLVGQVVRGEQFVAAANTFGVGPYWQLWLHPTDGSQRPVVAIVRSLPPSLQSRLTSENDEEMIPLADAPHVQIDGLYLKRLAYRSGEGAAIAPAIVGFIAAASGGPSDRSEISPAATTTSDASGDGATWITLAITALVGVGGAVLLMLRVNYTTKKLRALRRQKRNSELSWLSDKED